MEATLSELQGRVFTTDELVSAIATLIAGQLGDRILELVVTYYFKYAICTYI